MARIIGIDPGKTCGMVVLDEGKITSVFNIMSEQIYEKVANYIIYPYCTVVVEVIRPYSLRLTPQVIDTCEFIGELKFRLKTWAGANVETVARNQVKKWCFDTFPDVAVPIIQKKILKKGYVNKETGEPRKPSFVWVDDRIVTNCMKVKYKIPDVKPGFGYQHGLKEHSFQALAIGAYFESLRGETLPVYPLKI